MTHQQAHTQMCWTCACFPPCLTATVPISRGSLTKRCLLTVFGIQCKVFGATQCLLKLPGYVYVDQHKPSTSMTPPNPNPYPYTYNYSKVISSGIPNHEANYSERGNNAWFSHGTPHLNVRSDYTDTENENRYKYKSQTNIWRCM